MQRNRLRANTVTHAERWEARTWNSTRLAFSVGAAALFALCGVLPLSLSKGQDDMPPLIGAPSATTQADGKPYVGRPEAVPNPA
jgi:hypothetical protein